jgi:4-hydroxy-tetrahydrodipicolinate reductase
LQKPIRVIQYGVGAMGSNMVRLLQNRNAVVVGAIDIDPNKIGRDLGDVCGLGRKTGVVVRYPPEDVLNSVEADIVCHATTAFVKDAFDQIVKVIEHGMNVVTITQELFFPLPQHQREARLLDEKAKERGVRVLATGVNPGFIMDVVPVLMSSISWNVTGVRVRRIVDFSPYGPDEMKHIGAFLTADEFQQGADRGEIGHIGLLQTCAFLDHCLGLGLDDMKQTKEPLITTILRKTSFIEIPPGRVYGFKQNVYGYKAGREMVTLNMVGVLDPREDDGFQLGDYCLIEGSPDVQLEVKREVSQKGGLATAANAVNMIPRALAAAPGLITMKDLTLPHIWHQSAR